MKVESLVCEGKATIKLIGESNVEDEIINSFWQRGVVVEVEISNSGEMDARRASMTVALINGKEHK